MKADGLEGQSPATVSLVSGITLGEAGFVWGAGKVSLQVLHAAGSHVGHSHLMSRFILKSGLKQFVSTVELAGKL